MRWIVLVIGVVVGFGSGWLAHGPGGADGAPVAAETRVPAAVGQGAAEPLAGADARHPAPAPADQAPPAPRPPAVEAALAKWAKDGRSLSAARALRAAGATELAEAVEQIDSLRRVGQSALLEGDLDAADARWSEAIRREAALSIGGSSAASSELRRRLADAWHRRALVHEERGQLAEARAVWLRAVAIDPAHLDGLAGLQRLASRERGSDFPAIPGTWPKPTDRP